MEGSIAGFEQPCLPSRSVDLNQYLQPCFSGIISYFGQQEGVFIAGLEQQNVPSPRVDLRSLFLRPLFQPCLSGFLADYEDDLGQQTEFKEQVYENGSLYLSLSKHG